MTTESTRRLVALTGRGESTPPERRPTPTGQRTCSRELLLRSCPEDLLVRYRRDRQPEVREELVRRYLPLARRLAHRYRRDADGLDDLIQVAALALVKALDRFEPERGLRFTTYAVPTIVGELKRYCRDTGWGVHVARSVQDRAVQVNRAAAELSAGLGRSPTPSELGEAIGASAEQVLEAIEAARARETTPLDAPLAPDGEGDGVRADAIAREDPGFELAELNATIEPALRELPDDLRLILHLRFVEDRPQREIAAILGTSQMQISRLLRRALARLQAAAAAADELPRPAVARRAA